jgi:hypothetical protein
MTQALYAHMNNKTNKKKEIQIIITVRYHLTPARVPYIKKTKDYKYCKDTCTLLVYTISRDVNGTPVHY